MKIFWWILGIVGAAVIAGWLYRNYLANQLPAGITNKNDAAAQQQSDARNVGVGQAYPSIITPQASWVRMNGGIIDLNLLGGTIPPLVTVPAMSGLSSNG